MEAVVDLDAAAATFAAVYARDRDRLVRLATLLVDQQGQAEDIVNDAFAAAFERWDRLEAPSSYLRAAVVNRSRDALRRRRVARTLVAGRALVVDVSEPTDHVRDAIAALPSAQRAVLVLRFYEDLSIEAIAGLLRRKPGTVKSQLSRALATLREVIEP